MEISNKKAIVLHSGGMDSSLCLAVAIQAWGRQQVLSLSVRYEQRHNQELQQAARICQDWNVEHTEISLDFFQKITESALLNRNMPIKIKDSQGKTPANTMVLGRNGIMAQIAGIYAQKLAACCLYMGVIEVESTAGYRDCSRAYINLVQELLRLDLDNALFEIRTPLINMTKKETLELAYQLEILDYLLNETITCYNGLPYYGCRSCPACQLRNQGLEQFLAVHPEFKINYPTDVAEFS